MWTTGCSGMVGMIAEVNDREMERMPGEVPEIGQQAQVPAS